LSSLGALVVVADVFGRVELVGKKTYDPNNGLPSFGPSSYVLRHIQGLLEKKRLNLILKKHITLQVVEIKKMKRKKKKHTVASRAPAGAAAAI
jgi:hypothetical protein